MLWRILHQLKSKDAAVRRKAVEELCQKPNERSLRILGELVHRCFTAALSPIQVRQGLEQLRQASDLLVRQGVPIVEMAWTFERLRLFFQLRSDGPCLALFMENRPELTIAEVRAVWAEFAQLGANSQ